MYRRLKNLLGVSLIILAIVLSQLPMGAVQADTIAAQGTQQETDCTSVDTDSAEDNDIVSDDTNADNGAGTTESDNAQDSSYNENTTTDAGSNADNEVMLVDDIRGSNTLSGAAGTTESYTVTFDCGFVGLQTTVPESMTVESGNMIKVTTPWQISDKQGTRDLTENGIYEIDGIEYKFLGWFLDMECSSSKKWDFSTDPVTEKTELYAGWEYVLNDSKVFTLTYVAKGASAEKQLVTVKPGQRIKLPNIKKPSMQGYEFINWIDDATDKTVDLKIIPTKDMVFRAKWDTTQYKVTFHANGGKFDDTSTVTSDYIFSGKPIVNYPTINKDSYSGYTVEEDNWYTDKECLTLYQKETNGVETAVTGDITLYKRWTYITEKGFKMNPEGTVLYSFTGDQSEVMIPPTVKIIAKGAFADMKNIKSITLPAEIADIKEGSCPGAADITWTVKIYSSGGTTNSMTLGKQLANQYKNFEYVSSGNTGGSTSADSIVLDDVTCNLNEINKGIDDNNDFIYPEVTLPIDLPKGKYQVIFTELNTPTTIKTLLETQGYTYIYYMDISMKKLGELESYKPTWSTGTMTITMPLPVSWYGRDSAKIKMFTVNTAGTALEEVTISSNTNNIFTFHPKHFSEFALVYTGTLPSGGNNGSGSSGGNGSSGGSNSSGGNNGNDSSGGGNSSGGNNGSSSSGGSGSSGGNNGSSSSGGSGSSGGNSSMGTTTTPIEQLPMVTQPSSTQPAITPATGMGGSTGTIAHVKDSTPKTGDPLEYRSILVCSFFSIGVLLLLIGNKKKTSSSVPGLGA